MRNVFAVFWKELRSYFGSPIAYVMTAVFLFYCGFVFRNLVLDFHQASLTFEPRFHTGQPVNANDRVITPFFGVRLFIWLVVVPMLTMRLYAEEKKTGTIELLMTSPVASWQTLLGKFAACLGLFALMEAVGLVLLLVLSAYAEIDWGPVASGYLGTLLLGGTFISAGMLASALTDNQIIAAVVSFFGLMVLWMIEWSSHYVTSIFGRVLQSLSLVAHMQELNRGVIDTSDLVFFASATVLFLFVTNSVIESRRWRQ
jgi:ABC-2 type transport system permease protein